MKRFLPAQTILLPSPVLIIGTYGPDGRPNMMNAAWGGIASGRECDKFKETRLTPEKSKLVNAPIVREFPYALECTLVRQVDLGLHTMFIGEIVGMVADSEVLNPNQLPDIEKVRPMLFGSFGSMAYYRIGDKLGDAFSVGKELQGSQS